MDKLRFQLHIVFPYIIFSRSSILSNSTIHHNYLAYRQVVYFGQFSYWYFLIVYCNVYSVSTVVQLFFSWNELTIRWLVVPVIIYSFQCYSFNPTISHSPFVKNTKRLPLITYLYSPAPRYQTSANCRSNCSDLNSPFS